MALPALALKGRTPAQRQRLGWCLAAVAGVHALLLLHPSPRAATTPGAASAVRVVQVRHLPAAAAPRMAEDLTAARPRAMAPAHARQATQEPTAESAATRRAPAPPASDVDATYLPRAALTVPPRAKEPVAIDYPGFDGESDQYTGMFDLFIDDTGAVVRVVTATPDLPGILGHAVREAFRSAQFSPGEVNGQPVRSRMRIEVTFDSRKEQPSL